MSERERVNATSRLMSKIENAPNARVLRDEELDAVSGGVGFSWGASNPSILTVEIGIAPVTVPVVARRSLLESMAEDECGV